MATGENIQDNPGLSSRGQDGRPFLTVTISRQYGAGGAEIGHEVARQLGARCFDNDIITLAQQRIGEKLTEVSDERAHNFLDRLLFAMGQSSAAVTGFGTQVTLEADAENRYTQEIRAVIREIAQQGDAVIIGWGGQVVLKDLATALHVHIVALLEQRIATVMARENLDKAAALKRITHHEQGRADYLKYWYHIDWQDPLSFHLVINTGLLSKAEAVHLITHSARVQAKRH